MLSNFKEFFNVNKNQEIQYQLIYCKKKIKIIQKKLQNNYLGYLNYVSP